MNKRSMKTLVLVLLVAGFLFRPLYAQVNTTVKTKALQWQKCLLCHAKPDLKKVTPEGHVVSLFVDREKLLNSSHKNVRCQECHIDIVTIPHKGEIKRVDCTRCHYEGSPIEPKGTKRYTQFQKSVHGQALLKGDPKAPHCQDCHADHNILPAKDSRSQVNKFNIVQTCGKCHQNEYRDYEESIHAKLLTQKKPEAPSCTDCHGGHTIKPPTQKSSSVYSTKIPDTCSRCHSSVKIVGKYGIPTQQVLTYEDSFHGIATKFGDEKAANCASCHGYHSILPASDPRSPINKKNLPHTCGKCHKNANENFAKGKVHVDPHSKSSGIIYYVGLFFKYLTMSVLFALIVHIFLDLNRKFREKKEERKNS